MYNAITVLQFGILLLSSAFLLVGAANSDSALIRGGSRSTSSTLLQQQQQQLDSNNNNNSNNNNGNRRRHLLQESECELFRKCVQRPPTDDHPNGYSDDSWVCELSRDDAERLGTQFVDIVESSSLEGALKTATSGRSALVVSEAIVDVDPDFAPRLFVPPQVSVQVRDSSKNGAGKAAGNNNSPPTTGTLKTLVIRLSDENDVEVDSSVSDLIDDVFEDAASLKTQTEACSYNKLKIEPFEGTSPNGKKTIQNGIVNVKMEDFDMGGSSNDYTNAAFSAARDQLGDLGDARFDLVMFCYPPGNNGFIAYAYPNHRYSFYNNKWCGYVSSQMHEVGHNLGLAHSGTKSSEYGDVNGFMGFSYKQDDQFKCFNAQKHFQLKWFEDQVETLDPLTLYGGSAEYVLHGVSDYENPDADPNALISLRLKQSDKAQDFYIGYNRADGIHANTQDDINKITILRKESGDPYEYGQSTKIASLMPGQSHVLKDFNGESDRDIFISFVSKSDATGDAIILVADGEDPAPPLTGNCQTFTIEVQTDNYPEDNSWYVQDTDTGRTQPGASAGDYDQKFELYQKEICLPMGSSPKTYELIMIDSYGDGLCCSQGEGSYRARDDTGKVVVSGSEGGFKERKHLLQVRADPDTIDNPTTDPPTQSPTPKPCKNIKKKTLEFTYKDGGKEFNCKKWAKKEKCDKQIKDGPDQGKYIWELCNKSCKRCDNDDETIANSSSDSSEQ